jgi:hypothetical protein
MFGIGAWLAKSVLLKSLGGFVKGIPPKVWLILLGIAALIGAIVWHQLAAHKALKKADATGYARAKDEDAKALTKAHKEALAWKQTADAAKAKLAQEIKERNDEEARRIIRTADDLLVRGPGKARCGQSDHSSVAAASGGHATSGGQPGAAVDRLPDPQRVDLIGLPFAGTIGTAKQCDLNRSEALSWREWYERQSKAWPK